MLNQAIGGLLPAAIAVALSPFPIIAIVVVLGTPGARTAGPAFALGWIVGLAAVSTIVVVAAGGADEPGSTAATGVKWGTVALGLLFFVLALRTWRKRPREGQEVEAPKWMASIDHLTPRRAVVLGLGLSAANPKNLALIVAAAASIAQAGLSSRGEAIAVAVFVVIGSLTVAGSVLFYLVVPGPAARPLAAVKQFMTDHNTAIMLVVLLLLGAKLLGDGLGGL